MRNKGSLNLSINAIVVLILAITMLGLGLSFMRNIFSSATREFEEVSGTIHKQMIDQMKEGDKEIDLSSLVYDINPGEKKQVFIGFKNNANGERKFIIKGIKVSSMTEDDINCGLYEEDDVMLEYKHKATTVQAGDTVVLPMNIKVDSNTNKGTCFYEVLIDEEDGSLIAYWNFDKEDDATDISGNRNDGAIYGATWNNSGRFGRAYEFDGSNDYIECGLTDFAFEYSDPFSVELWAKWEATGERDMVGKMYQGAPYRGWNLQTYGSGVIRFTLLSTWSSAYVSIYTQSSWHDGNWHHIVGTSDGTGTAAGMKIYIDGGLRTDVSTQGDSLNNATIVDSANAHFRIGSRDGGGDGADFFDGIIDEVKFYNKVLFPTKIQQLYTGYDSSIQLTVNVN